MSRTYKDKPGKLRFDPWDKGRIKIPYTRKLVNWDGDLVEYEWKTYIYAKTTKTKKRKEVDTEWHWMSTPSWWNRLQHTRPERRRVNVALHMVSDVEEADIPDLGRKPHIYYW